MKEIFRILIVPIYFLSILQSSAATIEVRPGSAVSNVKEAVRIAQPNDFIVIYPGTYHESQIIIAKPLTIQGKKGAIIDADNESWIFEVNADRVTIKGLTLKNTGYSSMDDYAAIRLRTVSHCTVEENEIVDACFGVYLLNANNCVVKNNVIHASNKEQQRSGNGIHAWKCDSITLRSNTITGHRDGMYFEFVTHTGVYDNKSSQNLRYGIHFMFSNNDEYIGNWFSSNGSGVAVMFSNHVTILKNTFSYSTGGAAYGILLKEITDSRIEGNHFTHNTTAVYLEGSNRILLTKNLIQSNGWGCRMQASCYDVTVTGNNFSGNSFDLATNGILTANYFSGNYWDKYEGYDLDKNGIGDIPHQPVSLYSVIVERMPYSILLYRSFMVYLLDRSEKVFPAMQSENVKDQKPLMRPVDI